MTSIVFYNYRTTPITVSPANGGTAQVGSGSSLVVPITAVDYKVEYNLTSDGSPSPSFTITKSEVANLSAGGSFTCCVTDKINRMYPISDSTVVYGGVVRKLSDIHSPTIIISPEQGMSVDNIIHSGTWKNTQSHNWWMWIIIALIILIVIVILAVGAYWAYKKYESPY